MGGGGEGVEGGGCGLWLGGISEGFWLQAIVLFDHSISLDDSLFIYIFLEESRILLGIVIEG